MKHDQNIIDEGHSPTFPRLGGLAMIDASFGIAVPRSEPPLDALVLDRGMMGPALSSRPIIPANVPFACPCPRSHTSKVVRDMGPLMKPYAGTDRWS